MTVPCNPRNPCKEANIFACMIACACKGASQTIGFPAHWLLRGCSDMDTVFGRRSLPLHTRVVVDLALYGLVAGRPSPRSQHCAPNVLKILGREFHVHALVVHDFEENVHVHCAAAIDCWQVQRDIRRRVDRIELAALGGLRKGSRVVFTRKKVGPIILRNEPLVDFSRPKRLQPPQPHRMLQWPHLIAAIVIAWYADVSRKSSVFLAQLHKLLAVSCANIFRCPHAAFQGTPADDRPAADARVRLSCCGHASV